jgi:predicted glycosyltransferase|tara:strand:- start:12722 stop:13759 length:1038 start_codon:yes stop_codon:yes gene_type:complete
MKTLFLVQSNVGKGHHSRVNAFNNYIDDSRIITKSFTGVGNDIDFFNYEKNDLLQMYRDYDPDTIVTEGFPFGRYGWHPHFNKTIEHGGIIDILDDAKRRSKGIYSLDRDIPWVEPEQYRFHASVLNEYYNGILFHTDNNFIDPTTLIHNPIIDVDYISTNYVTQSFKPYEEYRNGIMVSGGDWYPHIEKYYNTALELQKKIGGQWTYIVGDRTSKEMLAKLVDSNSSVIHKPNINEYRELLAYNEVSISEIGAGTWLDVNLTKTPCVMIPKQFNNGGVWNTMGEMISHEQKYRADHYEIEGGGKVLLYDDINIDTMNDAIEYCRKLKVQRYNMNGKEYVRKFFN